MNLLLNMYVGFDLAPYFFWVKQEGKVPYWIFINKKYVEKEKKKPRK
jgi:hypothetical protein